MTAGETAQISMHKQTKVIVTGGCGFIGSHLVDRLVDDGYDVHIIDDLSAESNDQFYFNDRATYHRYSITNQYLPHEEIFNKAKFVFHLAAESRIGSSIENPVYAAEVNVVGTTRVLNYCKQYGIKKIIYSSTSSVYGNVCKLPTSETSKIDCLNPYSATKYAGEKMITMFHKLYGVKYTILRYFNVFGERSPCRGQYAPVIGIFLRQAQNQQPLTIVGDGEQSRDFVYVKDVVEANMLAVQSRKVGIYNIGSGTSLTINQIANRIDSTNQIHLEARPGEARSTLANISKAMKHLGFNPKVSVDSYIKSL